MRKVVLYSLLSLDGVAESPDDFVHVFDDAMRDHLARVVASQDCVLLGRRTYEEWAGYWPTSTEAPFAAFINDVAKYVVCSRPPASEWQQSTVVDGPVSDLVDELRSQPGGDIGVHGSIELARSMIEAELIDELRLVVTPALAGSGRRLFDSDSGRHLELIEAEPTPSGALLLGYRMRSHD
ncbi:dihydrofolate reductase family protein [Kribbella sp. CA-294648]|uniref:dihydrofolate reductase family protein n=1 Tax=Kribbella sp. CA-294648 TaxID=3239948 RepID=UPI003D8B6939